MVRPEDALEEQADRSHGQTRSHVTPLPVPSLRKRTTGSPNDRLRSLTVSCKRCFESLPESCSSRRAAMVNNFYTDRLFDSIRDGSCEMNLMDATLTWPGHIRRADL